MSMFDAAKPKLGQVFLGDPPRIWRGYPPANQQFDVENLGEEIKKTSMSFSIEGYPFVMDVAHSL